MKLPAFLSNDERHYERLQKDEQGEAEENPLHATITRRSRSRSRSWLTLLIALLIPVSALLGFVVGQRLSAPSDDQWLGEDHCSRVTKKIPLSKELKLTNFASSGRIHQPHL